MELLFLLNETTNIKGKQGLMMVEVKLYYNIKKWKNFKEYGRIIKVMLDAGDSAIIIKTWKVWRNYCKTWNMKEL